MSSNAKYLSIIDSYKLKNVYESLNGNLSFTVSKSIDL